MSYFKCCKSKEFVNLVCINCLNVFHPSCLERKTYKPVQGYKVYCSAKCEGQYKSEDNERLGLQLETKEKLLKQKSEELENLEIEKNSLIAELQDELSTLKKEIREKDEHYKRERRKTVDFEDEVYRNEESLHSELKQKAKAISELNCQIVEIKSSYQTIIQTHKEELNRMKSLESKLEDLKRENEQLSDSLLTLEEENARLNKKLERQLVDLKNLSAHNTIGSQNSVHGTPSHLGISNQQMPKHPQDRTTNAIKNKILIIGDDNIKGLNTILKTHTNYKFDINSRIIQSFSSEDIFKMCVPIAKKFGKNDYVFLFWSWKNSLCGKELNGGDLRKLLELFLDTNLTIINPPLHRDRPILNKFIEEDCLTINKVTRGIGSRTLNHLPTMQTTENGYLQYDQKVHLVKILFGTIMPNQKETRGSFFS